MAKAGGGRTAKVDATRPASVAIRSRHRNGTVSILIIWSDPNPPRDDSAGPAGHGLEPSPWLPPEPGLRGTVKQERRRTSRRSLLYWSSGLAAQTPDCPGQSRAPQGRMPQLVWRKRGSGLGPPPEMAGPSANQGISGQKKPACIDGPAGRPPRTMWRPPFLHAAPASHAHQFRLPLPLAHVTALLFFHPLQLLGHLRRQGEGDGPLPGEKPPTS